MLRSLFMMMMMMIQSNYFLRLTRNQLISTREHIYDACMARNLKFTCAKNLRIAYACMQEIQSRLRDVHRITSRTIFIIRMWLLWHTQPRTVAAPSFIQQLNMLTVCIERVHMHGCVWNEVIGRESLNVKECIHIQYYTYIYRIYLFIPFEPKNELFEKWLNQE